MVPAQPLGRERGALRPRPPARPRPHVPATPSRRRPRPRHPGAGPGPQKPVVPGPRPGHARGFLTLLPKARLPVATRARPASSRKSSPGWLASPPTPTPTHSSPPALRKPQTHTQGQGVVSKGILWGGGWRLWGWGRSPLPRLSALRTLSLPEGGVVLARWDR